MRRIYNIECEVRIYYLYFVVCKELDEPFEFKDISIVIELEGNVPLYVDPHYLVQSCKSKINGTYDCILNIQQSYNNATILGESVLKNNYMVFNMDI